MMLPGTSYGLFHGKADFVPALEVARLVAWLGLVCEVGKDPVRAEGQKDSDRAFPVNV